MTLQIAVVQFRPIRKNVGENIQTIKRLIGGIKADLIVLPELANSGYLYSSSDQLRTFAEEKSGDGPYLSALVELTKETGGVIVSGYAEIENNRLYNSAAAVSPSGIIQNYRKIHLYADEKLLFLPGNAEFQIFEWREVKTGMMICFDWIFPESARTLALLGAQIIAHPANLVMPYCQDAMVTRSIENHVFTITANRIGKENLNGKSLDFTGKSQITAPDGNILYRGPGSVPTVHVMTINPDLAVYKNISERNHLFEDRRPEYYFRK